MKIARPGLRRASAEGYLDGQLLVAMPLMSDPRFARSVIYMCAHSEDGAMGLIINQRASHISFPDLLERLGIITADGDDGIAEEIGELSIHVGGPVETGRGFVLHSADYFVDDSTLPIEGGVCLTATIDILKRWGVKQIKYLGLIAAPEGVERLTKAHPDVPVHIAAIDEKLNDIGFIVPGLGDAGDRQFGT